VAEQCDDPADDVSAEDAADEGQAELF